jgi:hypothetical protein
MTTAPVIAAAGALAEVLTRENAALAATDLAAATAILPEKQHAVAAFTAAVQAASGQGAGDAAGRRRAEAAATRLQALAAENRRLLERGLRVQGRVLAIVVKALPRVSGPAAGYGARGTFAARGQIGPALVSARV